MKKFRILVIALLCLTIGGVYATWTFADDNAIDRKGETVTVTLETKNETSQVLGSFFIDVSDFSMVIDQKADGDHTTKLVIEGDITLQFKPHANSSLDIRTNGVNAFYYFAVADSLKYQDDGDAEARNIFNMETYTITKPDEGTFYQIHTVDSVEDGNKWVWNAETGCFEFKLTHEMLAGEHGLIKMNDFVIDNSAEYAAFNEVLRSGTITLYLNDQATPNA